MDFVLLALTIAKLVGCLFLGFVVYAGRPHAAPGVPGLPARGGRQVPAVQAHAPSIRCRLLPLLPRGGALDADRHAS